MDVHKPHPFHNWREFLAEVGTIVLGVAIALCAEQAVEVLHWHSEVAQSKKFIAAELAVSLRFSVERLRTERCGEKRLDEIAHIIDLASRTGQLTAVGDIRRPPLRLWLSGEWESVVASQTANHFSASELSDIAYLYGFIRAADRVNTEELQDWTDLSVIEGPGRRFDPVAEAGLRQALSRARFANREIGAIAEQILATAEADHFPFEQSDLQDIEAERRRPLNGTVLCQPIGPGNISSNGQAPFAEVLPEIDKAAKAPLHWNSP
jgi:hypothetical protein